VHGFLRWQDSTANLAAHIHRINQKDRVFLHYGDLNDAHSVAEAVRGSQPDYVFPRAAQSYPKTSFVAPAETLATNIIGTVHLLEALRRLAPKALAHICSSSEVYGRVPKENVPIREDCSFHPASPYAISKIGTDLLGRHYAEAYGLHIQTTRMFSHTGPRRGDVFVESSFAKQIAMIEAGLSPKVIKVGNLKSMRTWADVRDAVRAYYMLLTVNPVAGACYNIGGTYSCTVGDMLKFLLDMSPLGPYIAVEEDPERLRPIDADLQVPDCTAFRVHTGWDPLISFTQTMSDLLDYWRKKILAEGEQLSR